MRRYRIDNWAEYNRSLIKRGSLTMWVENGAIDGWLVSHRAKKRGRAEKYSDDAILMMLILREVYSLPLRALRGLVLSIFALMRLDLPVPCYTRVCRRAQRLGRVFKRRCKRGVVDVVFDSTGLKVYGEGEWKVRTHGAGKRRTWKKFHVGIDSCTQEILVSELTTIKGGDAATAQNMLARIGSPLGQVLGDGAYDSQDLWHAVERMGGDLLVPPPKNAAYKGAVNGWERKRDSALAEIQGLGGDQEARGLWKKLKGYHRRSLVETTMYRLKQLLGRQLRSRCEANQSIESQCKCLILNKMTKLGLPRGWWEEMAVS